MAPYEALYGRRYRTPVCWEEVGEREPSKVELIDQTKEIVSIVRKRLQAAQSRQKSYVDNRRRPLEFNVRDHVFLKVSPLKGSLRFEILQKVGPVAYHPTLPPSLQGIHDVFHVSNLRRYIPDPNHVIWHDQPQLMKNLTYVKEPMKILGRREKTLRNRTIPFVKVL